MPAMPPRPAEAVQRTRAVRQVLSYASHNAHPVVGLAPEGADTPGGVLGKLPPGAGRFIILLSEYCPHIYPVGVWKVNGQIRLKFGEPYLLSLPDGLAVKERDRWVGDTVMQRIAALLPSQFRGGYR